MRGMLMSETTMSKSPLLGKQSQSLDAVAREHECDEPSLICRRNFCRTRVFEIGLVVDDEDVRGHEGPRGSVQPASISPRSSGKSIGLVNSPAAPPRAAFRRVSASP